MAEECRARAKLWRAWSVRRVINQRPETSETCQHMLIVPWTRLVAHDVDISSARIKKQHAFSSPADRPLAVIMSLSKLESEAESPNFRPDPSR